jgi:hypothetical protein
MQSETPHRIKLSAGEDVYNRARMGDSTLTTDELNMRICYKSKCIGVAVVWNGSGGTARTLWTCSECLSIPQRQYHFPISQFHSQGLQTMLSQSDKVQGVEVALEILKGSDACSKTAHGAQRYKSRVLTDVAEAVVKLAHMMRDLKTHTQRDKSEHDADQPYLHLLCIMQDRPRTKLGVISCVANTIVSGFVWGVSTIRWSIQNVIAFMEDPSRALRFIEALEAWDDSQKQLQLSCSMRQLCDEFVHELVITAYIELRTP